MRSSAYNLRESLKGYGFITPWLVGFLAFTLIPVALSVPLCLITALGAALLLNAEIRGRAVYRTIVFLPSIVPAVASAMIWLWLFNPKLGLVNFVLQAVGVKEPPG